jgi:hypothetical protein
MFSEVGLLSNKEGDRILLNEWNELVGRAAAKASGETFEMKDTVDVVKSIIGAERAEEHKIIPALKWYVYNDASWSASGLMSICVGWVPFLPILLKLILRFLLSLKAP